MPIASAADLLALLRQHSLLEAPQLEELTRSGADSSDARTLATSLIERAWLTAYQANHLLQGKARELVLGPYVLLELLGAGGMGEVFKARHQKLNRVVALKLIHKDRLANPDAIKRFYREIQAVAALDHPNIVRAYDAAQSRNAHFLTMEYVKGSDLSQWVKEHGPLPVAEACSYIRQAALGLQHAAERGLVHRDIKPHNLLLARSETGTAVVKVLDMGLALIARPEHGEDSTSTLTQQGLVMGTLDYMAPEQAEDSHTVDIRADLYSLGCTFYFLLTGRVPHPGGDALAKLMKHRFEQPQPLGELRPDVPAEVVAVVSRLMAKEPKDRFQTPAELADTLAAIAAQPQGAIQPQPPAKPLPQRAADASPFNFQDTRSATQVLLETPPPLGHARRPALPKRLLAGIGVSLICLLVAVGFFFRQPPSAKEDNGEKPVNSNNNARPGPGPLRSTFTNRVGMEFALVPKGKAWLGGGKDKPGTKVEIPQDFYLGVYEVTQEEWQKVMGNNPSGFNGVAGMAKEEQKRLPVESVSWEDCQLFVKRVNEQATEAGWVYRLPTQVEWEYACRGGSMTEKGDSAFDFYIEKPSNTLLPAQANFKDSGLNRTCKVGSYPPNRLGLHDMNGNVCEWCDDQLPGGERALWGGCWTRTNVDCRAATRYTLGPSYKAKNVGLRLAQVPIRKQGTLPSTTTNDGFVSLFNGKDLTGWMNDNEARWKVVDGAITCEGATSHLYANRSDFADFHLQVEAKINEFGNSGVYFRALRGGGLPPGYEAQINIKGDSFQTGSLWGIAMTTEPPPPPDTWFRMEIIAQGRRIRILVNGKQTVDYTDPAHRWTTGTIALQCLGAGTQVAFRNIAIQALKSDAPPLVIAPGQPQLLKHVNYFGAGSTSGVAGHIFQSGVSADGKLFFGAGDAGPSGIIRVFESATGQQVQGLVLGGQPWYSSVQFVPGNKYVAASYSHQKDIYVWDIAAGKVVKTFVGHAAPSPYFAVAPNGKHLLSWGEDGKVLLWDVASGQLHKTLVGHTDKAQGVFSPDSTKVLTFGPDKTLRLWSVETGLELKKLTGHLAACTGCFSPDGTQALSWSADGTLRLWNLATETEIRRCAGAKGKLAFAGFVAGGRLVVAHCQETKDFCIWQADNGELVRTINYAKYNDDNNCTMAASPNGEQALVGNWTDSSVRVLDLATGNETHRIGNCTNARAFSFSADGTLAVAGSFRAGMYVLRLPRVP